MISEFSILEVFLLGIIVGLIVTMLLVLLSGGRR